MVDWLYVCAAFIFVISSVLSLSFLRTIAFTTLRKGEFLSSLPVPPHALHYAISAQNMHYSMLGSAVIDVPDSPTEPVTTSVREGCSLAVLVEGGSIVSLFGFTPLLLCFSQLWLSFTSF
jgi:hypothetical protein